MKIRLLIILLLLFSVNVFGQISLENKVQENVSNFGYYKFIEIISKPHLINSKYFGLNGRIKKLISFYKEGKLEVDFLEKGLLSDVKFYPIKKDSSVFKLNLKYKFDQNGKVIYCIFKDENNDKERITFDKEERFSKVVFKNGINFFKYLNNGEKEMTFFKNNKVFRSKLRFKMILDSNSRALEFYWFKNNKSENAKMRNKYNVDSVFDNNKDAGIQLINTFKYDSVQIDSSYSRGNPYTHYYVNDTNITHRDNRIEKSVEVSYFKNGIITKDTTRSKSDFGFSNYNEKGQLLDFYLVSKEENDSIFCEFAGKNTYDSLGRYLTESYIEKWGNHSKFDTTITEYFYKNDEIMVLTKKSNINETYNFTLDWKLKSFVKKVFVSEPKLETEEVENENIYLDAFGFDDSKKAEYKALFTFDNNENLIQSQYFENGKLVKVNTREIEYY